MLREGWVEVPVLRGERSRQRPHDPSAAPLQTQVAFTVSVVVGLPGSFIQLRCFTSNKKDFGRGIFILAG